MFDWINVCRQLAVALGLTAAYMKNCTSVSDRSPLGISSAKACPSSFIHSDIFSYQEFATDSAGWVE